MSDRVDRLVEQEAALAAKLKRTRDERLREERRLASRRAEVVGNVVLRGVKEGRLDREWLRALLDENLARKADRALFDLERPAEDESDPEPTREVAERDADDAGDKVEPVPLAPSLVR